MSSRTEQAIVDSFLKLLDERPINKISVRDIVEDCGINRNTFYYHFADIHALVDEVVRSFFGQIITNYAGVSSLYECFDAAMQYICAHRRRALHLYNSRNREIFERHLMEYAHFAVTTYMDAAFPRADILEGDRAIIINTYACECYGLMIDWLNHGLTEEWRASFRRLCELRTGTVERMIRRSEEDKRRRGEAGGKL